MARGLVAGWLANPDAGSHGGDHHSGCMLLRPMPLSARSCAVYAVAALQACKFWLLPITVRSFASPSKKDVSGKSIE